MKKLITFMILISVWVLFSSTFAQTDMVKLIRAENYRACSYNYDNERNFLIQVKNVAYEKHVYVHQKMNDGLWIDIPAHYDRQCNSIYELWSLDTISENFGDQFVLKYEVLGQTFWDNNNGANYTVLSETTYNGPGPMLGNGINVLLRHAFCSVDGNNCLYADIDVRNIAYAKNVVLTYTTDNWQTSTSLNAEYQYCSGPRSTHKSACAYVFWPNAYNIERWRVVSPTLVTGPVQFYISYTVNGQTYYDNNYWSNYVSSNDPDFF